MFSLLADCSQKARGNPNTLSRREQWMQVCQFLLDDLNHHDFKHAALVLATLVHDIEHLSTEIWKCGAEVLSQEPATRHEVLPFLKRLFLQLPVKDREELMLEIMLVLVSEVSVSEAYVFCMRLTQSCLLKREMDTKLMVQFLRKAPLQRHKYWIYHIRQKPFKDNPMLRGYCGLLAYLLWMEEQDSMPAETTSGFQSGLVFDLNSMVAMGSASRVTAHGQDLSQLKVTALKCFKSLEDVPGQWDTFMLAYVKLVELCDDDLDSSAEVRRILEKYQEVNPSSPNATYFLCLHLLHLHSTKKGTVHEVRLVMLQLVEIFPMCDLLLDFMPFAESVEEAATVLLQHLDYPQCARHVQGWLLLYECLVQLGSAAPLLPAWHDDRAYWWPKCYFSESSLLCDDEDVVQACMRCAAILLPCESDREAESARELSNSEEDNR